MLAVLRRLSKIIQLSSALAVSVVKSAMAKEAILHKIGYCYAIDRAKF